MRFGSWLFGIAALLIVSNPAQARHKVHHHHYQRVVARSVIVCNRFGCNDRMQAQEIRKERRAVHYETAGGYGRAIAGVSPECRPWRGVTCGCELSLKIFGRVINSPNLKQAYVWGRVFHHVTAAIGMVPGRSHHVAYIIGGHKGAWTLWDPNSGGWKTHIRTSDLSEFSWIVDPHSRDIAAR